MRTPSMRSRLGGLDWQLDQRQQPRVLDRGGAVAEPNEVHLALRGDVVEEVWPILARRESGPELVR